MLHNHKHDHCQHADVKFCQDCNVVYCRSCNKEWPSYNMTWGSTTYRTPLGVQFGQYANQLTSKMAAGLNAVNNNLTTLEQKVTEKAAHKHK